MMFHYLSDSGFRLEIDADTPGIADEGAALFGRNIAATFHPAVREGEPDERIAAAVAWQFGTLADPNVRCALGLNISMEEERARW